MTPEETFTVVQLEVGHLCIFASPIYIHVPKEKMTKLEPLDEKVTFVGYSESPKAYKLYILESRQIEVSRDVSFKEEMAFKKARGSNMEIDNELVTPKEMVSSPPPGV